MTTTLFAEPRAVRCLGIDFNEICREMGPRVRGLARHLMRKSCRTVQDEEDIAQCVFHSFSRGLRDGRYEQVSDRHAIWCLLAQITKRRVIDQLRYDRRDRRIPKSVQDDSYPMGEVADISANPESRLLAAEAHRVMMDTLEDQRLQEVAAGRIRGLTHVEIASELGCSTRTIERRMAEVRNRLKPKASCCEVC